MKITIYGAKPETHALAFLVDRIPEGSKDVVIQTPPRNEPNRRPCQHPNWLTYTLTANLQDGSTKWITLIQKDPSAPMEIHYA